MSDHPELGKWKLVATMRVGIVFLVILEFCFVQLLVFFKLYVGIL